MDNTDFKNDVTVVIPTYNEGRSIVELINRITESFKESKVKLEIIVVDDNSPDGTAEKARSVETNCDLKVLVREKERGLATAVAYGFRHASGRYLSVIDGDLQHPPDIIYRLLKSAQEQSAEMAVASRKAAGGGTANWEPHRVLISETATFIAKFLLPISLFKIGDATTGCFLFKNGCVELSRLSPIGFKIFLEVLVKGNFSKTIEVAYTFNQRSLGESKMTFRENLLFIVHILKLGVPTGESIIPIAVALLVLYGASLLLLGTVFT